MLLPKTPHSSDDVGAGKPSLRGVTVLIVDDNAGQRAYLRKLYESFGCRVVAEASDGEEALARLGDVTPDIISLDVLMPVMHGLEVLVTLRRRKHPSKVMLVTALGRIDGRIQDRSVTYQPDAVCGKKDSPEEFHDAMCEILGLEENVLPVAQPDVPQAVGGGRR